MRLSIKSIKLKNFLSYGNKWQEVHFKNGITLITGHDVDKGRSNGSGKSSLLEAIPVGLFGKASKPINKADFINWKNKKNCEIINTFYIDNTKYSILRAIKPDKLEIYKDEKLIEEIAHDKRILQKEIENEIIGIDYKTFMNTIYSNLNNLDTILLMSKPDKRKFLEKIFNLSYFSLFTDKTNKKINKIEESIQEYNNIISNNERYILDISTQNEDIRRKIEKMKDSSSKLLEKEQKYKEILKKVNIDELRIKIKDMEAEITEKISDISLIESNINKINIKKKYISSIIKQINKEVQNEELLRESLSEYKSIEDKIKNINILDESFVEEQISIIERKGEEERDISKKKKKIDENIIKKKVEVSPEIEENLLKGKTKCPTCKSIIDSERLIKEENERIKNIKEEIKKLVLEKDFLDKEISKIIDDITNIESVLKKNDKKIKEKNELKLKLSKIEIIEDKIRNIEDAKKRRDRFKKTSIKIDLYTNKKTSIINHLEETIDKINKKVNPSKKIMEKLEIIEQEINDMYDKVEQERILKEELENIIDNNNNKIKQLGMEKKNSTKRITNLQILKDHFVAIKSICSDENIKQYAISKKIPYVMKRMNYYLNKSGFDFYVILNKWLEHEIKGPGITGKSLKNFSNGEIKSVDLSLRFAFMDSSKVSSGIWPDIILADELLDSSIDNIGLNNIMEILTLKQKEDNMKILLVSHRSEIDNIDVDNTIEIVKERGFSRIL